MFIKYGCILSDFTEIIQYPPVYITTGSECSGGLKHLKKIFTIPP